MDTRVAVVGSLNMDLVVHTSRIPQPGETVIGGEFYTMPGGKGANQAVAAARLGAQVAMIGRVGRDVFAQSLLDSLAADGVNHAFVLRDDEAATGVALIAVDEGGENSIVVASGANAHLSPADVEAAQEAIRSADVLVLQLESPLESVIRAAEIAKAAGVSVVLNPAPARPLPAALLALVDVLIPNESEASLLAAIPAEDRAEAAAAALREKGVGIVILTLGARGAILARAERAEFVPAFDVTPVDTTAAGDAFVGGFVVALAEGRGPVEAVWWGNAAGALAATRPGAQPSLPTRREVEKLLGER